MVLREFARIKKLTPSPDGSHDNLTGVLPPRGAAIDKAERVLKIWPGTLKGLSAKVFQTREKMLSERGWIDERLGKHYDWLEKAKEDGVTFDDITRGFSEEFGFGEYDQLQLFKHHDERHTADLVSVLLFDSVVNHKEGDPSPWHRYRRIHRFTLEFASRIGFWDLDENIYRRFPGLHCSPEESVLTPRISHPTAEFSLSFVLQGTQISSLEHPYFTRGVSIIRQ